MKGVRTLSLVLSAMLIFSGCSATSPSSSTAPEISLAQLLGRMPVRDSIEARWVCSSILGLGGEGIAEICNKVGPPGTALNAQAEYALQGLAVYVTRPGGEADRLMFVTALGKALEHPRSPEFASFLLGRIQVAGQSESIGLLSRFLTDDRLCEPAAQAMVAIRGGAEAAFLSAVAGARRNNRITIIKSLGELRSQKAVEMLLGQASSDDTGIRLAALYALGNIGDPRAEKVLETAATRGLASERTEVMSCYVLFAQRQAERGDSAGAVAISKLLLATPTVRGGDHVRAAALELLLEAKGEDAIDDLIGAMTDSSTQVRAAALRLAAHIPGKTPTARWIAELQRVDVRREVLSMLGNRGDESAYQAVSDAVNDADPDVRATAIDAAVRLKGEKSLTFLLSLLERSREPADIASVRRALERLPSDQVISAAVRSLPRVTPRACAMLMDHLAKYGNAVPATPVFVQAASGDDQCRLAALRALGAIAGEKDLQELIALLFRARNEDEQLAAQKSLASVCLRISPSEIRADHILEAYESTTPDQRRQLLRLLGRVGGSRALVLVMRESRSPDATTRDAAVRGLADWPTIDAFDSLLAVARSTEKMNLRVLALRGGVRLVEHSSLNPATAVRYLEKTLAVAERTDEKRLVLGALATLRTKEALTLVIPYLGDDSLGLDAAMAAGKISAARQEEKEQLGASQVARVFIETMVHSRFRNQVGRNFDAAAGVNEPPEGFVPLFNGRNLDGWKGLVENPVVRATISAERLAAAQSRADSVMRAHWSVREGILVFDGAGESICTARDYGDFEMFVDWKIEKHGDSGIYLRGAPQVQIWDPSQWPEGSGGLYNNQKNPSRPLRCADNPIGEWNTFRIRMIGERVTVYLNNVLVVDSVVLENYWDRSIPIFPTGQIELQSHNSPLFFRNIFIREIPQRPLLFSGNLFNGVDLRGWKIVGGRDSAWGVENGVLYTTGDGGGWLSTEREYGNFELDLDFRLPDGGNSGVFLRSPRQGDPAYAGMEIQVLDDYAAEYAHLQPWQYCGSIYGVQAPSVRASKKAHEWQHYHIVARGRYVAVTLNGQLIVDADLVYHMDKESSHPGLKRRSGFIGLQSHSLRVEYRNITLREIESKEDNDTH